QVIEKKEGPSVPVQPRLKFRRFKLGVVAALLVLGACDSEQVEQKDVVRLVRAIEVGTEGSLGRQWFPGQAKAVQEVELAFRVDGQLTSLPIQVGDEVAEGDIIAELDAVSYEAEVQRLDANLASAEAALANAELLLSRQEKLLESEFAAQQRVDTLRSQAAQARANTKGIAAAKRLAEIDLEHTTLMAPFSGQVVAKYVENFQEVRAKQAVVRIVDASQIEMIVDVPEHLISLAPQLETAEVIFDAFPDASLTATVEEIGAEASETTRTYPVTLVMDQLDNIRILPGMAGRARGATLKQLVPSEDRIIIPVTAVFSADEGKSFVWVIDAASETVSRREVVIDGFRDSGIPVRQGLEVGELIATAGVHFLNEGQRVKLSEGSELE
ncbi:MAG: efflux RND transporter periplasmic adaptor subunit, partial [Geminicoccaceae bacterium]